MKAVAAIAWVLGLALTTAGAAPLSLHRGVGVHEWLNWSPVAADGSYVWPPYRGQAEWLAGARPISDWPAGDEFARIRSMGFDFVRLSVDPGPLVASRGKRRQEALKVLSDAVEQVTSAGLRVVFEAANPATRVAYLDDADDPGVRVEVIEGAGMRDMIAHGIAEARAWDGAAPVRIIDASAAA